MNQTTTATSEFVHALTLALNSAVSVARAQHAVNAEKQDAASPEGSVAARHLGTLTTQYATLCNDLFLLAPTICSANSTMLSPAAMLQAPRRSATVSLHCIAPRWTVCATLMGRLKAWKLKSISCAPRWASWKKNASKQQFSLRGRESPKNSLLSRGCSQLSGGDPIAGRLFPAPAGLFPLGAAVATPNVRVFPTYAGSPSKSHPHPWQHEQSYSPTPREWSATVCSTGRKVRCLRGRGQRP